MLFKKAVESHHLFLKGEHKEHSDKVKAVLHDSFPGAMPGHVIEGKAYDCLKEHGFTADNTLFADCSCPDEVNHDDPEDDISSIFTKRWGEVFNLGGLAGLPFTGKTGWGAFSAHCPKDGNIVVLFAPHVGISSDGEVGKVYRTGQDHSSSACGASIGALAHLN